MAKSRLRKLFRVRLRSLFVLITLLAITAAAWLQFVQPFVRQASAIEKLRTLPTNITIVPPHYDWQKKWFGMEFATSFRCDPQPMDLEILSEIGNLIYLRELYLPSTIANDSIAARISRLGDLRVLSMWRTEITDDGLASIANCRDLQVLDIHTTSITDRGLISIEKLQKLKHLVLGGLVCGRGLESVAKLKNLVTLDLRRASVSSDSIKYLRGSSITKLLLPRCDMDRKACEVFAKLRNLKSVSFDGTIASDDLAWLSNQKRIQMQFVFTSKPESVASAEQIEQQLDRWSAYQPEFTSEQVQQDTTILWPGRLSELSREIHNVSYDVYGFADSGQIRIPRTHRSRPSYPARYDPSAMKRVVNLKHVYVRKILPKHPPLFRHLFRLVSLHIDDTSFSDADLESLTFYNPLKTITLPIECISRDAVMKFRARHPHVTLRMREPLPTGPGAFLELESASQALLDAASKRDSIRNLRLKRLPQRVELNSLANLPKLSSLELFNSELDPVASWSLTTDLPNVTVFHAPHHSISDENASALQHLPALQDLLLAGAPVSDHSLQYLQHCKSLRTIDLRSLSDLNPGIRGHGLQWLKGCTELEELNLEGNPIEGKNLEHLVALPSLRTVYLSHSRIDDEGCRYLAQMPHLETLYLVRAERITDKGMKYLSQSKSLSQLFIGSHKITDDGLNEMLSNKSLTILRLYLTKTTSEGREEFYNARPELRFSVRR